MDNCLFCKIIEKKIPSSVVYETDKVLAFKDIHPQAKIHYLFIHKAHTKNILEMTQELNQLNDIFSAIKEFTQTEKLDESGFRLVNNCGSLAGQTVFHTHFHLLSGEALRGFGA